MGKKISYFFTIGEKYAFSLLFLSPFNNFFSQPVILPYFCPPGGLNRKVFTPVLRSKGPRHRSYKNLLSLTYKIYGPRTIAIGLIPYLITRRRANSGRYYGSSSYLAYHLKKTFHLSISLWNSIFNILSPNLSRVLTWIVIAFYDNSLAKFIYKSLYIYSRSHSYRSND